MIKIKNIIVISLLLVTVFSLTKCTNEDNITEDKTELLSPYKISIVSNSQLVKKEIFKWQIEKFGGVDNFQKSRKGGENEIEFDYDNLSLTTMKDVSGEAIVVKQVGYDENNPINQSIGFYKNAKNEFVNALIIKTENISENITQLTYLDIYNTPLLSIEFNKEKQSNKIIYQKGSNLMSKNSSADCGQDTIDCVTDLYTNHSWWSVGMWVASALGPEVPIAAAIACAIAECIIY
jgi:hypothetical protein